MRTLQGRLRLGVLSVGLASVVAMPAIAQDHSMHMPMPARPQEASKPEKEKARKKPAAAKAHAHHAGAASQTQDPHGAMTHPASTAPVDESTPQQPADAAHDMHDMHDMEGMPGMDDMPHTGMPGASGLPVTPIPPLTDADRAAAVAPQGGHPAHDNTIRSYTLFDRLETWDSDDGAALEWEATTWIGTDLNRVWLRSEGERVDGHTEHADLEVLYGRSVAPWWDVVAGVRHDFKPGASEDFAAIGIMGLAPYKFEVSATAYVGSSGQTSARLEAEYETLLTNRLILQPLVEVNLFGKDDPRRGIGSGLSTVEAGLRLRYEITRRFAPYVGIVHERAFGNTADFRRGSSEGVDDTRLVAGLRLWF